MRTTTIRMYHPETSHLRRAAFWADRLVLLQGRSTCDADPGLDPNRKHRDEDTERDEHEREQVLTGHDSFESDRDEEHARDLHDHNQPLGPREVLDRLDFLLVRQPRRLPRLQRHRRRGVVRHAASPSCASSSSEGSSGCSSATSSASSSAFGSGFGGGAFGVGVSAAGGGAAGFVAGTGATGFGAGAGVAGLAAAGATTTGLGGSGAGGVVDTTRPAFTTNPCFATIVVASNRHAIARFS